MDEVTKISAGRVIDIFFALARAMFVWAPLSQIDLLMASRHRLNPIWTKENGMLLSEWYVSRIWVMKNLLLTLYYHCPWRQLPNKMACRYCSNLCDMDGFAWPSYKLRWVFILKAYVNTYAADFCHRGDNPSQLAWRSCKIINNSRIGTISACHFVRQFAPWAVITEREREKHTFRQNSFKNNRGEV